MSVTLDDSAERMSDHTELLGQDRHEWEAPDKSHHVTFGRPRGLASLKVAKVLGPQQAANIVLSTMFYAILGIKAFDGETFFEPRTEMEFEAAVYRFGTNDTADMNFNDYVIAWQRALHPEMFNEMQIAREAGEPPETLDRIAKNAGSVTAKKSPRVRGSIKSSDSVAE